MKSIQSILLTCLLIFSFSKAADSNPGSPESPVQKFNQAAESWKQLQKEIETLPAGTLKQAAHLSEYAGRMNKVIMEMHNATQDLPVSETTKVCLDYALHKTCDLCNCTAECCEKAKAENRTVSPEEMDAIVVKAEKSACKCTLPIRLAIRHDLQKAGVSDQETLDLILMIPEGAEYKGVAEVVWEKASDAGEQK